MVEWEKLIPKPKSTFLVVKCSKCGNEQTIFSHVVNNVGCNICGTEIAAPSGGKSIIKGEIIKIFE